MTFFSFSQELLSATMVCIHGNLRGDLPKRVRRVNENCLLPKSKFWTTRVNLWCIFWDGWIIKVEGELTFFLSESTFLTIIGNFCLLWNGFSCHITLIRVYIIDKVSNTFYMLLISFIIRTKTIALQKSLS